MKRDKLDFLKLLYNPGETICVSPNQYSYHSIEQKDLIKDIKLISPNDKVEPEIIKESDINLISINPVNGFRRDDNVTAFRSFLIELDEGTEEEQREYIENSGIPYSVCVFSGNKSLHYGIVLEKDMPDMNLWRFTNQWILNILDKADPLCKNPSRSIRYPGNKRHDGRQLTQELREIKTRVSLEELGNWLNKYEHKKPKMKKPREIPGLPLDMESLPRWVNEELEKGVDSNRNNTWFRIGCEFAKLGFDLDDTLDRLDQYYEEEHDFKRREWETCIKSGFKHVEMDS